MDLTGQTLLGKYEIEGLLGQGGMGAVWRARHSMTGRKLAVKVLDKGYVNNAQVSARFGREARAASLIQHPGIVEVLDLDKTDDGVPFMVMEFLEGETLARRIERRGRLDQAETLRLGSMLLEALDAAHTHGVIHRDLKPENIYVVPAGRRGEAVKILDFGISQVQTAQERKLTMTGSVLGTPHYMSPEQAMGENQLDHRADIYAAGVVLYECVVGDVPYDAPNYNKLLRLILDEDPPPPRERGAQISPELERVILWAMEKERDQRVPSAKEMLEWLRRAAEGESPPYAAHGAVDVELDLPDLDMSPPKPAGSLPSHPSSGSFTLDEGWSAASSPSQGRVSTPRPAAPRTPAPSAPRTPVPARAAPATPQPSPPVPDEESGWTVSPTLASMAGKPVSSAPPPSGQVELDMDIGLGLGAGGPMDLELDEEALASTRSSAGATPAVGGAAIGTASSSGRFRSISPSSTGNHPAVGTASSAGAVGAPRHASGVRSPPPLTSGLHSVPPRLSELSDRPTAVEPDEAPAWRRYVLIGAIALAVFAGLVFAVRWTLEPGPGPEPDPGALVEPRPPPDAPPDPPSAASWVSIRVVGLPPGARMSLDGLPARSPLRVRRGGQPTLVIEAPGYQRRTIRLETDRNRTVHARMQPAN